MKKAGIRFLKAILAWCARLTIARFKPIVVAVTGSVGKTSAKEAISIALASEHTVRATSANFNNELGTPLTILGGWKKIARPAFLFWLWVIFISLTRVFFGKKASYPTYLVLEYGADKPGDIEYLCTIARPRIGVITAVGDVPVHVEFYPDSQALMREKATLVWQLPVSGKAIVNADDVWAKNIIEKTRASVTTFGTTDDAQVKIVNCAHTTNGLGDITGMTGKIEWDGVSIPISIPGAFSFSHMYAVAAACAVSHVSHVNMVKAIEALGALYSPIKGRSVLMRGINDTQLVDESYNSSPLALEMALKSMGSISSRRKIAILGDMMELGSQSEKAHATLGAYATRCVDVVVTIGARARWFAQGAQKAGMNSESVYSYETVAQAQEVIKNLIHQGDIILIKGSRVVGLEKIVEQLKDK